MTNTGRRVLAVQALEGKQPVGALRLGIGASRSEGTTLAGAHQIGR